MLLCQMFFVYVWKSRIRHSSSFGKENAGKMLDLSSRYPLTFAYRIKSVMFHFEQ